MPNGFDRDQELTRARYNVRIGELFTMVHSSDHDVQCRALAMTNWEELRLPDAIALLSPLSTDSSAEIRQLVALQLAAVAGAAEDPRALQALVTLAADEDESVRRAAAQSSYVAREFSLTSARQSAKSPADRFVHWQQKGETTTFSFRCPNIATAKRFLAIMAGLNAREMTHPSDEKQTQATPPRTNEVGEQPRRLPDVLIEDEQFEVVDLPRTGVAKPVVNVSKGSIRLPDVFIED